MSMVSLCLYLKQLKRQKACFDSEGSRKFWSRNEKEYNRDLQIIIFGYAQLCLSWEYCFQQGIWGGTPKGHNRDLRRIIFSYKHG